jgi:peptidoglycan/xylan/chitin deacetylase (PgdA/CDA1 family)
MGPRRNPVPRAQDAWAWLGGTALLGILGAGVVAAAVVLWENVDMRRLAPQLAPPAPRPPAPVAPPLPARAGAPFEAALFDSPRSRDYFPDAGYYASTLASWEALVRESGGAVRRVGTAAELQALRPDELLVLTETPCVSDAEMAAIRGHVRRSGSVVASWAVGARDGSCAWRGWGPVAELTGAEAVREIPSRQGLFLTVPGGVALSPGLAPGTRIELRPDPALALRLSGPRVYWSDWALNPQPDETGGGADVAAVAADTPAGGRVAWFGYRLAQAVTPTDSVNLRRLVQNGVLWAAGVPVAAPAPWPEARTAALVIALDVEDEPGNAAATADLLRERGIEGSFYAVSQLVEGDAELAAALAAAGEVGSQTSDNTPVAGLTAQEQRIRLRRSWTEIERWTGHGPRGLHPPEETFDAGTLEAWAAAGGTYLLATNEARSGSPEIHRVDDATIVLLPRLLKDDYNTIVQNHVIRAQLLGRAWLDGMRKQRAIGGLAVVAGHTQIMRPGARIDALAAVLDSAQSQGDWWTASAARVAGWWRVRHETRLAFVAPETAPRPGVVAAGIDDLLVEAPAGDAVTGLWVDVVLPSAREALIPLVDGMSVDFTQTGWGMRVPVGDLAPGGSRRISFVRVETGAAGVPWT